ncbi:hypothetical protein TSOC_010260 [Tetrabaena socialis]|uniref:C1q domain-containing protein n=1 Tax=Tetrabaena socialis TaxID=47790 RepID=A0A2J7ZTQ3_9CHLO|nr:hypothetical protein TSOC_010260 [Tetrabaena socialis]|eukprot:PNH03656.1 hypothetical protein TSOC_010260 [Tetrabaena socialis]
MLLGGKDIVRLTFKAFHDVLRAQGDAIKAVERTVDTKAGRAEMATSLQQKANAADMAARLREAANEAVVKCVPCVSTVSRFVAEEKAGGAAAWGKGRAEVEDELWDKVSRKMFQEALSRKADVAQLDQTEARVGQELADLRALAARKADATALEEVSSRTERLRQRVEADSDTTAAALRTISATFDNTLADVRGRLEGCSSQLATLHRNMGSCETQLREVDTQFRESMSKKADAVEVYRLLDRKADAAAVTEALQHKASQETVEAVLSKVDGALDLASRLDALQRDVDGKLSEAKSLYTAMEGLARVEDVNKALLEVCAELENKAPVNEIVRLERQQGVVNSGFAQNMYMASTHLGFRVATILTVSPGLYEVSFGFYPAGGGPRARRAAPPHIQLLVNGEVALTALANPHAVQHAPGGGGGAATPNGSSGARSPRMGSAAPGSPGMERATSTTGLSSSPATGLTGWDVLALPAKAKLAVTYAGEERGEGFLGLRKL